MRRAATAIKVAVDVDARARELMHDLDRAKLCQKEDIDSFVLHGSSQRFPTLVLRQQLGIALDQVRRAWMCAWMRACARACAIAEWSMHPDGTSRTNT